MQIKELDPGNASASKNVLRLTPIVDERREKMKTEMLGACGHILQLNTVRCLTSNLACMPAAYFPELLHARHVPCDWFDGFFFGSWASCVQQTEAQCHIACCRSIAVLLYLHDQYKV